MVVNNKDLSTIWFEDNKSTVQIIDQRFLPYELKILLKGSICKNYTFDVTPAKYITKPITKKGNIYPNTNSISQLNID